MNLFLKSMDLSFSKNNMVIFISVNLLRGYVSHPRDFRFSLLAVSPRQHKFCLLLHMLRGKAIKKQTEEENFRSPNTVEDCAYKELEMLGMFFLNSDHG